MKIVIPTQNENGLAALVEQHFGRAPFFAVVDRNTREVEFVPNRGTHHGGSQTPAVVLLDLKPDMVICGGMGPKAVDILNAGGVKVMMGAKETVGETVGTLDAGGLFTATEATACKDHKDGDHEHDHQH